MYKVCPLRECVTSDTWKEASQENPVRPRRRDVAKEELLVDSEAFGKNALREGQKSTAPLAGERVAREADEPGGRLAHEQLSPTKGPVRSHRAQCRSQMRKSDRRANAASVIGV